MKKLWNDGAWEEYEYWLKQDRKTTNRINKLLRDIERNGCFGIGKPEALSGDYAGWWSVHIDEKNRLIFRIREGQLEIAACKGHYGDK